jgi:predicted DNA-binding transcriptional regulator AlpA
MGKYMHLNHEVLVLTVEECAGLLKIATITWRRLVKSGKAPLPRRIGHLLRWDIEEFYLWWKNRTPSRKELEDFKAATKNQRRNGI